MVDGYHLSKFTMSHPMYFVNLALGLFNCVVYGNKMTEILLALLLKHFC